MCYENHSKTDTSDSVNQCSEVACHGATSDSVYQRTVKWRVAALCSIAYFGEDFLSGRLSE